MSMLTVGSRGASVRLLQQRLKQAGFDPGGTDGVYGARTKAAVRAFQRSKGLDVDGKVGDETGRALLRRRATDSFEPAAPSRSTRSSRASRSARPAPAPEPAPSRSSRSSRTERPTRPTPSGAGDLRARITGTSNAGRRNQLITGQVTVNGRTYNFRSGGYGKGSLPPGDYTVTPHLWSRSDRSMNVGGVGYSFALSNKYDPRVGATRSALRIHPDGRSPGTEGCIGIVGNAAVQRQFREDMRAELARHGGRFTLSVG